MTEQSKNRRRQDKVIKDRTVEGEAGEERKRGEDTRAEDWNGIGQDTREQHWVIIMVIQSGSERRVAEQRWLTQMHFQWNMECHNAPQGEDHQSKVRKHTEHFICLWFSFRLTPLLDSRKRYCHLQSPVPLSYCHCHCQAFHSCIPHVRFVMKMMADLPLQIHRDFLQNNWF